MPTTAETVPRPPPRRHSLDPAQRLGSGERPDHRRGRLPRCRHQQRGGRPRSRVRRRAADTTRRDVHRGRADRPRGRRTGHRGSGGRVWLAAKEFVDRLLETGAVGCNLEDSLERRLTDPAEQADYLAEVRAAAGADLVINARIDTFIRPGAEAVTEAMRRGRAVSPGRCGLHLSDHGSDRGAARPRRGIGGPINAHAAPGRPDGRRADRRGSYPDLVRHQPAQAPDGLVAGAAADAGMSHHRPCLIA